MGAKRRVIHIFRGFAAENIPRLQPLGGDPGVSPKVSAGTFGVSRGYGVPPRRRETLPPHSHTWSAAPVQAARIWLPHTRAARLARASARAACLPHRMGCGHRAAGRAGCGSGCGRCRRWSAWAALCRARLSAGRAARAAPATRRRARCCFCRSPARSPRTALPRFCRSPAAGSTGRAGRGGSRCARPAARRTGSPPQLRI